MVKIGNPFDPLYLVHKTNTLTSISKGKIIIEAIHPGEFNQATIWSIKGLPFIYKNKREKPELLQITGTNLIELINRAYKKLIIDRPILCHIKDGLTINKFQFTEDGTITEGKGPYQRPFEE
jgi:hypothetical protein